jgi:predicted GNAT family acetyltransferase
MEGDAEEDGYPMGELTYSRAGMGRVLVDAAVAWARETHTRLMPLCPYARSVFEKDPSLADVRQR